MNNNHIKGVIIIFTIIVIILYNITNCKSQFNNRPIWPCPYNENRLKHIYINEASGKYTSQSLFDIYSFTHISHGILLFYILYYLNNYKIYNSMIYISLFYEILWEIIENTPMIINRYRKASNISRNYPGDSIINSIGDVISMSIGFYLCLYYPKYGFIILLFNELFLYYYIKDNLMTNIYQIFFKTIN
tara:strand:+ start:53 stop:619 length:567 start_codon:yes stop_codon:yes gene_type:complete